MHEGKIRNRMANSSKKKKVDLGVPQGSVLGLEPELELFEVWEINVRQIIIIAIGFNTFISQTSNSFSSGSRQAREELKKRKIIYIQFPR